MARLPILQAADLAPEHRDLVASGINLHQVMANSPGAARAFRPIRQHLREDSRLAPRLRELAVLAVAYAANSPYEYSHHIKIGLAAGLADSDIRAVAAEARGDGSGLAPLEKAVLAAARELTTQCRLSDTLFDTLAAALDRECLTDLIVVISLYNAIVRITGGLEIDVEEEYRVHLERYPLPARREG
ncbi:MAG: carboxymuconolactone decarboxylase family protein [Betaproteobacteria bacterium]|nr:carboxymuconolactone decarboxylase family protein [Betaproteobacteria bacterium]